jgi:cytoskeleton protein RodZ
MNTLGDKLKKERELKGISLDQMAANTRIQKKFLQALEEDKFDSLPAAVFVTGFLRSYAAQVGLDPNPLVQEYEAIRQTTAPQPEQARKQAEQKESSGKFAVVVTSLAALALVLFAFSYFHDAKPQKHAVKPPPVEDDLIIPTAPPTTQTRQGLAETMPAAIPAQPAPQTAPTVEQKPPVEAPKPVDAKPAKPEAKVEPQKSKETTAVEKPTVTPKGEQQPAKYQYNVTLTATKEDVWIYAVIDDAEVRDMYIRSGKSVVIHGNKGFSLTTGNAFYLQVKVNGKLVRIPGSDTNKVIRNWPVPLE